MRRALRRLTPISSLMFLSLLVSHAGPVADTYAQSLARTGDTIERGGPENCTCIPSGDHTSIQNALNGEGAAAVLCPNAIFELGDSIFFTANNQQIYTSGLPTDSTRALLRVVGASVATAVNGEHYDHVAVRNVIIDGNRPQLGFADGALINFGRGIEDRAVEGQLVEWVRAYEPRGWTVIYLGGICTGAVVRNNVLGPAGRAEYLIGDGVSVECPNSVVMNNTIIDATDGGIVIFQSPGSLITNNTIRAENRIMFYGISMEDYHPLEGDFTGTRVTGNIIDAAGAQIRRGIGMGPHVGCHPDGEPIQRSRGAIITGNTLMGDHMAYGFVVSGVEDWTVTGNVDLSTHLTPFREGDCMGTPADDPAGFQYDARTASGTFQPEFQAAVLGGSTDMWPLVSIVDEPCVSDLIGEALLDEIRAGSRGNVWEALEAAPNGERIEHCMSIYEPPDISDLLGDVGVELLPCEPYCLELRMFNLSDDTADLRQAVFLLEGFPVTCDGLPDSLEPWEEINCIINDYVAWGFNVFQWFGFKYDYGFAGFSYPFDPTSVTPGEMNSPVPGPSTLTRNYPNPFNPSTTIEYSIPEGGEVPVLLNIYDLRGRLTRSLVDEVQGPGRHVVDWNGRDNSGREVGSGLYLYCVDAAGVRSSRKMTILR